MPTRGILKMNALILIAALETSGSQDGLAPLIIFVVLDVALIGMAILKFDRYFRHNPFWLFDGKPSGELSTALGACFLTGLAVASIGITTIGWSFYAGGVTETFAVLGSVLVIIVAPAVVILGWAGFITAHAVEHRRYRAHNFQPKFAWARIDTQRRAEEQEAEASG
jgi:hypothetical protein